MSDFVFVSQFLIGKGSKKFAVKDSIDVSGHPTKMASGALDSVAPAQKHASVVERLLAASYQLVGKLNMHEFAFGMTGVNHWTGTPVNFLYPDYIPGGSSSGSAVAVAQGLVDISLGTDTGGSVRLPAACCGVYGFKPTFGRVSRAGVMPLTTELDCVGPFARDIAGIIETMSIIDPSFKAIANITNTANIRIGVIAVDADDAIQTTINQFLENSDFTLVAMKLPSLRLAFEAGLTLINVEAASSYGQYVVHEETRNKVGEDIVKRLAMAAKATEEQLTNAKNIRDNFNAEVDSLLQQVDVLVMPTLPSFPMLREQALAGNVDLNISSLVRPFNVSGHPAIAMPLKESLGRPVSLQLVAAKGKDELLCEITRLLSKTV